jgi:hypothetical protein
MTEQPDGETSTVNNARRFRMTTTTILVVLLLALTAHTTGAGAEEQDLSTPRGAATAFGKAMISGDVQAAKAAAVGDEPNLRMIDILAPATAAQNGLRQAAIAKFGESGKALVPGQDPASVDVAKEMASADVKEDGDSAVIKSTKPEAANAAVNLKKVNGEWRVDLAHSAQAGLIARQLPAVQALTPVINEVAADITAGKYDNVNAAGAALKSKAAAAMAAVQRPAPQGAHPAGDTQSPSPAPTPAPAPAPPPAASQPGQ